MHLWVNPESESVSTEVVHDQSIIFKRHFLRFYPNLIPSCTLYMQGDAYSLWAWTLNPAFYTAADHVKKEKTKKCFVLPRAVVGRLCWAKRLKNPSMVNNTRSSNQSVPPHRLFINSYTAAELMLGVSLFAANQNSPCSLCVRRSGAQARVCRVCGIHFNSLCVAHTRLYFSGTIHHKCFYHVRKDLAEVLFYLPFSQLRTMRLKNGIRRRPTGKLKLYPS